MFDTVHSCLNSHIDVLGLCVDGYPQSQRMRFVNRSIYFLLRVVSRYLDMIGATLELSPYCVTPALWATGLEDLCILVSWRRF